MDKFIKFKKYGKITFVDDYICVVFIEVEERLESGVWIPGGNRSHGK